MYEYSARLVRVIDGDTLDMDVDVGFNIHTRQRIRLLGINCPEHGTIAGTDATAFTKGWFAQNGPDVTLRTVLDRREKYGRMLGQIIANTRILNNGLVTAGLAVDYTGGRRLPIQPGEPEPGHPVP